MKTKVSVQLLVFVECTGNWGDDCSLAQVKKQAKEEAIKIATRLLAKDPLVKRIESGEVTISAII